MPSRPIVALAALIVSLGLLGASASEAGTIDMDLTGRIEAEGGNLWDHGYGAHGIWLGKSFRSRYLYSGYMNWRWDDVAMTIDSVTGDATIGGTMTRLWDHSTWGLSIELTDFQGTPHMGMLDDMMGTSNMLEWGGVAMTLAAPYATSVPLYGWVGYAMPEIGHYFPAEVSWDAEHGVHVDLWYKNPHHASYWYRVGDTKGNGGPPVPEPTAVLAFGAGLLVLGTRLRRQRS